MKRYLLIPVLLMITVVCNGQQSDSTKRDSGVRRITTTTPPPARQRSDSQIGGRTDSMANVNRRHVQNQVESSPPLNHNPGEPDSSGLAGTGTGNGIDSSSISDSLAGRDSLGLAPVVRGNQQAKVKPHTEVYPGDEKTFAGKEVFFYAICSLLLLLGLFRTFYSHYFSNLFRVYFNTSLRQSQLSEQLLQARLPSFLLNIFFVLIAGAFVWVLLTNKEASAVKQPVLLLQICVGAVAVIYLIKFCFLKFIGWISGISEATNYYIFIIFLVNKLLSLMLLPFLILLLFGKSEWFGIIETLALLSVGALFVSRYIKSYALAGHKLSVKPFHFLLFIAGAELIPILLLYKVAVDYLLI